MTLLLKLWKGCNLGDTIGAKGDAFDSVITRIMSG